MAEALHVIVQTPDKTLLDVAGVTSVYVELADGGGIGILPGHAPLLAETVRGSLHYTRDDDASQTRDLAAGILHITREAVTIFTSGWADDTRQTPQSTTDDARFDRLAIDLLTALRADPNAVMDVEYDEKASATDTT